MDDTIDHLAATHQHSGEYLLTLQAVDGCEEPRTTLDQMIDFIIGCLDAAVNNAGTEGKPGPVTEQTIDYARYRVSAPTSVRW